MIDHSGHISQFPTLSVKYRLTIFCLVRSRKTSSYLFSCKSLLQNHVFSELCLRYLKMVAIRTGQGKRSAGKEVNRDIGVATLNLGTMRT